MIIPESFHLSSYSVQDGTRIWRVRGLPCEMRSVASYDDEWLHINGWGFAQHQPGRHVATVAFAAGLTRYDKNGDGLVAKDEVSGTDPMDTMLPPANFDAFDLDRDGKLTTSDWEVLAVGALNDEAFATPAIADGRLYVRTRSVRSCFGT